MTIYEISMRFDHSPYQVYHNGKLQNDTTDPKSTRIVIQNTYQSILWSSHPFITELPSLIDIYPYSTMSILQYPHLNTRLALPKLQQDNPNTNWYNPSFHPPPLRTNHLNRSQYDIRYPVRIIRPTSLRF
jgi:hypothetical protein